MIGMNKQITHLAPVTDTKVFAKAILVNDKWLRVIYVMPDYVRCRNKIVIARSLVRGWKF